MPLAGALTIRRELRVSGQEAATESWTLGVDDPDEEHIVRHAPDRLLAVVIAPPGQAVNVMAAMLVAQAVENGLEARDTLLGTPGDG